MCGVERDSVCACTYVCDRVSERKGLMWQELVVVESEKEMPASFFYLALAIENKRTQRERKPDN